MSPAFVVTRSYNMGLNLTRSAEADAWVAAVIANGGTVSSGRRVLVETLIDGIKSDYVWNKLDRLWLYAAENEPSALTDLVATTLATNNGPLTFTANDGYTGVDDGAGFINNSTDPSLGGLNYQLSSASVFAWVFGNTIAAGTTERLFGSNSAARTAEMNPRDNNNEVSWHINDSGPEHLDASTDSSGLWCMSLDTSGTQGLYRNGSLYSTPHATTTPAINGNFVSLRSGANTGYGGICCCFGLGGYLQDVDIASLYTRIRTYMTAVGVP